MLDAYEQWRRVPAGQRVATLPSVCPAAASITWSVSIVITHPVSGGAENKPWNLFHQRWLVEKELQMDPARKGISCWPLVGLYSASGFVAAGPAEDVAVIGMEQLKPADQHVHLVEEVMCVFCVLFLTGSDFIRYSELEAGQFLELKDWHLGSDMSRFRLANPRPPICTAYAVCASLESRRIEVRQLTLMRCSNT